MDKKNRCPKCGGKSVPLKKSFLFSLGRKKMKFIKCNQQYRCKRCKNEFEVEK